MRSGSLPSRPGLWAITSYFNPARYQRKRHNFRSFREHLTVPLVAAELGFDGRFDLDAGDADVLVRVQGGDVLWQKERLLNLALQALPPDCDTVAWLDCDVIFDGAEWAGRARRALEQFEIVHLFHERHNLPPEAPLGGLRHWRAPATSVSLVHKLATGALGLEALPFGGGQLTTGGTTGLAWASRREGLDRHGFYDACVIGGGDRVMLCSAYGHFDLAHLGQRMNARRAEHHLAWARPFYATVRGRVGSIPGRLFHLWHGDLVDRHYQARFDLLAHFDPFTDVALDPGGCWRWASPKAELHAAVRAYFEQRFEDGRERATLVPSGAAAAP